MFNLDFVLEILEDLKEAAQMAEQNEKKRNQDNDVLFMVKKEK